MGKTVSFVVREDLAEWLESRAEAEMKTVSSVVQDIVAAEYRRQSGAEAPEQEEEQEEDSGEQTDILDEHPDAWYRPDSDNYEYAVRHPEGGDTRYYKSRESAASMLERRWEETK